MSSGLTITAALGADGVVVFGRKVAPSYEMTRRESIALGMVLRAVESGERERIARLLEDLPEVVAVSCSVGGVEADVAALARALRKGAVVS
ncbi:hypothetical protein [Sorangium sp. So ce388]|uniref:hypothetical protein n=1 Tax=Sorangium sp. So ce388 TaxID=3133309 RepID=UPI003F5BC3E2